MKFVEQFSLLKLQSFSQRLETAISSERGIQDTLLLDCRKYHL